MADSTTHANNKYFDKEAETYDTKHAKTLDYIMQRIRAERDFIGADWIDEDDDNDDDGKAGTTKTIRLLDYACGTGNISRALAPYTTQCVGIDLSKGMVEAYNARARNQGLSPSEMAAYQGNLCSPRDDDAPPQDLSDLAPPASFDVAAVGLGFHHFEDPDLAARRLADRLRPGGVLFIVDFLTHDGALPSGAEEAKATVAHQHGFSEGRIREVFEGAGVGAGFGIVEIGTIKAPRHDGGGGGGGGEGHEPAPKRVFLARGTKV